MYAIVTDDRSGEELARYTLADADLLDPQHWAERFAAEWGVSLAEKTGRVPNGCADFSVTVQDVPGSPVCWSSESFFIAGEGV